MTKPTTVSELDQETVSPPGEILEDNEVSEVGAEGQSKILLYPEHNILELQNVLFDDTMDRLREELDDNIARNGQLTYEDQRMDVFGKVTHRTKVYETDNARKVIANILTNNVVHASASQMHDLSWHLYYSMTANKFEVAMSRYPAGEGFYRWHTDHGTDPNSGDPVRVLTFVLFLNSCDGGELEISKEYATAEHLTEKGWNDFTPVCQYAPEPGNLIMFPTHYPHRVLPCKTVREVLHGHVTL